MVRDVHGVGKHVVVDVERARAPEHAATAETDYCVSAEKKYGFRGRLIVRCIFCVCLKILEIWIVL